MGRLFDPDDASTWPAWKLRFSSKIPKEWTGPVLSSNHDRYSLWANRIDDEKHGPPPHRTFSYRWFPSKRKLGIVTNNIEDGKDLYDLYLLVRRRFPKQCNHSQVMGYLNYQYERGLPHGFRRDLYDAIHDSKTYDDVFPLIEGACTALLQKQEVFNAEIAKHNE